MMADKPSGSKDGTNEAPAPEVLQPKADKSAEAHAGPDAATGAHPASPARKFRRGSYRPSHRATFIGLAVVIVILGANTGIIAYVLRAQNKKIQEAQGQVTISQSALDKVGVNDTPIGTSGIVLTVNPDAHFKGSVAVAGSLSIGGKLILNNQLTAGNASFAQLTAGNVAVQQLNVNGDVTASNLNLRSNLVVTGSTRLQGPATLSQLLTVNNSADIAGNLAVGGTLSVASFHTSHLISDYGLTFGGHVITEGSSPSVSKGSALRSTDTVSMSGNDASGTVAVNIGAGSVSGDVADITFRSPYSNTPHVIITAVGDGASDVYVNRSASGFSIGVGSLATGGHAFDYIVEQ